MGFSIISELKECLRTIASASNEVDKVNVRSIARGASEQSFQFPALIDDTIPVDLATTIMRNLDRVYASWTQIYLSSIGLIDLNYVKNPKQFIAKYQPKFRLESCDDSVEECDEQLRDELYGDDEAFFSKSTDECDIDAIITPTDPTSGVTQLLRKGMVPHLDGVNTAGIISPGMKMEAADANTMMDSLLSSKIQSNKDKETADILRATENTRAPKMTEADIKKLNDMQPYAIELKLLATKGDTSFSNWINFVVGVKTTMHLAKSNMLILNMVNVLKNRNPIFNFIRWTTGEISLMKDIILHLDDINFDIANKADRTGKYISSLRRLKKRFVKVGTFGVNRMAPFATIVISSSTYRAIKEDYGFDLKNVTFAQKIREELFLMCLIIVDDATHTVDMLVDGQHDFQTYSLETLEREVTMNSNKLGKELTRMLGSN